jgi:hypothetical protein
MSGQHTPRFEVGDEAIVESAWHTRTYPIEGQRVKVVVRSYGLGYIYTVRDTTNELWNVLEVDLSYTPEFLEKWGGV